MGDGLFWSVGYPAGKVVNPFHDGLDVAFFLVLVCHFGLPCDVCVGLWLKPWYKFTFVG